MTPNSSGLLSNTKESSKLHHALDGLCPFISLIDLNTMLVAGKRFSYWLDLGKFGWIDVAMHERGVFTFGDREGGRGFCAVGSIFG